MEKETKQQEIDIYCIIRDVLHDLWVAIIVGISAAFLAYIGARLLYQPTYTSRTTFVVSARKYRCLCEPNEDAEADGCFSVGHGQPCIEEKSK